MSPPNDQVLGELAQWMRARDADPDQRALEALSRGELPVRELALLRERAGSDPALGRALQLYAPLPAAAQERIAQQLLAARHQVAVSARPRPRARLSPRRLVATALALAAACLLASVHGARGPGALPEYTLAVVSAPTLERGAPHLPAEATPVVVHPMTHLVIQLRPASPTRAAAHASAYLVSRHGQWPWPIRRSERSPQGAFELRLAAPPATLAVGERAELVVRLSDAPEANPGKQRQRWAVAVVGAADPRAR